MCLQANNCYSCLVFQLKCRLFIEYPGLEVTPKDHEVQPIQALLYRNIPKSHTMCLRILTKCFLESVRLGAVAPSSLPSSGQLYITLMLWCPRPHTALEEGTALSLLSVQSSLCAIRHRARHHLVLSPPSQSLLSLIKESWKIVQIFLQWKAVKFYALKTWKWCWTPRLMIYTMKAKHIHE